MTRKNLWGGALLVLGVVFCPCHLLITLPLLGAWLGGTALTGFVTRNANLVITVSFVLFVGSMLAGWALINHKPACELEPGQARDLATQEGEMVHGAQEHV